jgi:murein DD-endopeptidase MepM/ murein hydrolase activator NlpD
MLPINKQTTGETVPPTLLVRFVQKILISKAFIALVTLTLFVPTYVHAGIFSFFSSVADAQGKTEITKNSQTLTLSDPSVIVSAVMGGDDVDTTILSDDNVLSTEVGPMGTALDVEQYVPDSDQISLYIVKKGDTIKTVAALFDVTPNTIIWANNLSENPTLKEGQMLTILPVTGLRYTFKKGDTIKSIAKKYGADTSDVELFNGITADTIIEPGTVIIIPNGEQQTVAVPVTKTTKGPTTKSQTGKYTGKGVYKLKSTGELDLSGPKSGDAVMRSARGEKTWGFNAAEYTGYYMFPVKGGIVTQGLHAFNGVDISAPKGTPVMAAADGVVIADSRGTYGGGYGTYLAIKHPNGTQTLYAHNTSNIVTVGQSVTKGQVIAYVGSTGHSTGPHSHFEIRGAKNPFATKGTTGDANSKD